MSLVIVPNELCDRINAKIDSLPGVENLDAATRAQLYADVLSIYDEHGELPDIRLIPSEENLK